MRKTVFFLVFLHFLVSCAKLGGSKVGELRISFDDTSEIVTRSGQEIPDTSDFILYVTDAGGNVVYEGKYGDSPESMIVDAGSYNVKVMSREFTKPAFSSPQYGDEQCVLVPEDGVVNVRLLCMQMNSGIRLDISSGFLTAYPSSALRLKSDDGSLTYSYSEKRIAYFRPGNVSLVMTEGAKDEVLMTRRMEAQEILTLTVAAASGEGVEASSSGISIAIDTSRYWIDESYVIGDGNGKGDSEERSLTVSQAKASVGEEDV